MRTFTLLLVVRISHFCWLRMAFPFQNAELVRLPILEETERCGCQQVCVRLVQSKERFHYDFCKASLVIYMVMV